MFKLSACTHTSTNQSFNMTRHLDIAEIAKKIPQRHFEGNPFVSVLPNPKNTKRMRTFICLLRASNIMTEYSCCFQKCDSSTGHRFLCNCLPINFEHIFKT
jgi:hypothetical protein